MQYRNTSIVQSVTQLQPCEHCCALLQIKIVFIYIMRLAAIGEKLRLINFVSTEIVHFILRQWHKLHNIEFISTKYFILDPTFLRVYSFVHVYLKN